jgi:hypothetical protein
MLFMKHTNHQLDSMVPAVARDSTWGRLGMVKQIADVYRQVLTS